MLCVRRASELESWIDASGYDGNGVSVCMVEEEVLMEVVFNLM